MHTPFTIGRAFEDNIKKITQLKTIIEITGVYCDNEGKLFGKFYYDKLKTLEKDEVVTLLVPVDKKALLIDGKIYKLRCLVEPKVKNNCVAELLLKVEEIINQETGFDPRKRETILQKSEILKTFHSRKQENISLLLKTQMALPIKSDLPIKSNSLYKI